MIRRPTAMEWVGWAAISLAVHALVIAAVLAGGLS